MIQILFQRENLEFFSLWIKTIQIIKITKIKNI